MTQLNSHTAAPAPLGVPTQQATSAAKDSLRHKKLPGEEGVWIFIVGDMMIFGIFFLVFAYYYALEPALFLASQAKLNAHYGALNTLLLLSSSWFVVMALNAYRKKLLGLANGLIALAFMCGAGFATIKFMEYGEKLDHGITMTTNYFFMFYYIYTAIHFFHVTVGMVILAILWFKTRKPVATVNEQSIRFFEGGAAFWHMVDLLWIVLFPLLYLVR